MKSILKYGGLVVELLSLLFVGYFIGGYFDKQVENPRPLFALMFMMVFLFGGLYRVYKSVTKDD